jgi:hypothetical protein
MRVFSGANDKPKTLETDAPRLTLGNRHRVEKKKA